MSWTFNNLLCWQVRGHLVTAFAWDTPDRITSESSGLVLIGTALGLVFEAELVDSGPERGALMGGLFKANTLERRWEQVGQNN